MPWNLKEAIVFVAFAAMSFCQNRQYDESIQAAKISLFVWQDPNNQYQLSLPYLSKNYTFTFKEQFKANPQVALGLYTLDSEYSVFFMVEYQDVTTTNMTVWIYKLTPNRLNQIYIMYFGTDYLNFECVLIRYDSSVLSIDNNSTSEQRQQKSESQVFNFQKQRNISDTYITLFLAGLHLQSQTTEAGFKYNYTDFLMDAEPINDDSKESGLTYSFRLTVMTSGRVSIYSIQFFYIAYEKSKVEAGGRFILNSGKLSRDSFGGMVSQSNKSVSVPQLYQEFYIKTEAFFFGLNDLRARNGYIRILGVEQVTGLAEELMFTLVMQTWQYTFVENVAFSYLQIKKIRCDKDPYLALGLVNCPNACADYFYMANQTCLPCHYSCVTCTNSTSCTTCSPLGTRHLNITCLCNSGYFDTLQLNCVPCNKNCLECQSSMICTSCRQEQYRFLNPITRDCQCQFGYISLNNDLVCHACVVGCSNCTTTATCSSCMYGYFWVNSTFCSKLCNHTQSYNYSTNGCDSVQASSSTTTLSKGKFDYNWYYGFNGTDLTIYMFITRPDVLYYYYQGGNGYTMNGLAHKGDGNGSGSTLANSSDSAGFGAGGAGFGASYGTAFFDDGNGFYRGYSSSRGASNIDTVTSGKQWGAWTTTTTTTASQSYSQSNVETDQLNSSELGTSTHSTVVSSEGSTTTTIRTVETDGTVTTRTFTIPSNTTSYYYMNTGEINRYRIEGEPDNANYADALNQNLEFRIQGDLIPIKVVGSSANSFVITARPTKSYIDGRGVLVVKDQGLVVYDKVVGIQDKSEPVTIFRYDHYSEEMIKLSSNLSDTNKLIVQIVWGVSKILLFLGLGWPVMPVMLTMQYIFSHAYITAKMPLNLDYFLRSFQDFRNPSILFMKQRDALDHSIFPAVNSVYKVVPEYNTYDRGIDFLFNDFQFLLTCALSFLLLAVLYGIAVLVLASSDYVVSPIMNYFWRRKMVHLGAYALVTALPISFFFFGQMHDVGLGNSLKYQAYSNGNLLVAMMTFAGLLSVPPLLAYFLYSKFNYERVYRAKEDVQMMMLLKSAVQNETGHWELTQHNQPLWSIDEASKLGYLWMAVLYYKMMLFAWCVSFFAGNSSFQLMGMVAINSCFLLFTLFSGFFTNRAYKIYFLTQLGTMIAYEVVVAMLSSDRSVTTDGLMNLGYLGIGILYLLWMSAFLFSCWLLWGTIKHLFVNYLSKGKFLLLKPKTLEAIQNLTPVRQRALTGRKSVILEGKRLTTRIGSQVKRSNMVPGSQMLFRSADQEDRIIEKSITGGVSTLGLKSNAILKKATLKQDFPFEAIESRVQQRNGNNYLAPPSVQMQSSLPAVRTSPIDYTVGATQNISASAANNSLKEEAVSTMRLQVPDLPQPQPFVPDSRFHITTDKRIVMKALPPREAYQQVEYIPSITNLVQQTVVTKKTIISQKSVVGAGGQPPVIGMSAQLVQAATEQPYTIESSSMGPRGRTVVLRQIYAQHNIYIILNEVNDQLWQRLSTAGTNIQLAQAGHLLLNGKTETVNLKIQQLAHQQQQLLGNKLVLWKFVGNTALLRSQNNGSLYTIPNIVDRSTIMQLNDPKSNITLEGQTVYLNGGQFYKLPQPTHIPAGHQRLVFGGIEGQDVLLYETSNGHVVRVEEMTDQETLQKLSNPQNVITSDGQTIFVNGQDICQEEPEPNELQPNQNQFKGVVSNLSPTSAGSSKLQSKIVDQRLATTKNSSVTANHKSVKFLLAAIPPADFSLSEDALNNAEWISDEITSVDQIGSLMEFLSSNFSGCRYLVHEITMNTYHEATPQLISEIKTRYNA